MLPWVIGVFLVPPPSSCVGGWSIWCNGGGGIPGAFGVLNLNARRDRNGRCLREGFVGAYRFASRDDSSDPERRRDGRSSSMGTVVKSVLRHVAEVWCGCSCWAPHCEVRPRRSTTRRAQAQAVHLHIEMRLSTSRQAPQASTWACAPCLVSMSLSPPSSTTAAKTDCRRLAGRYPANVRRPTGTSPDTPQRAPVPADKYVRCSKGRRAFGYRLHPGLAATPRQGHQVPHYLPLEEGPSSSRLHSESGPSSWHQCHV
ncbi:hypothetical protein BKA63DRAFT_190391 [Paraphoma chrysanthemicola]|nr:hypothetical protein BKA63DRAFT_190391 [Paraphoma chrysanthemicola]